MTLFAIFLFPRYKAIGFMFQLQTALSAVFHLLMQPCFVF